MSKVPELYVGKSQNRCAYHNNKNSLRFLIFQLGQIKIVGQADTCPFSTKKKIAFPYQIYGRNKDFLVFRQKWFLPSC